MPDHLLALRMAYKSAWDACAELETQDANHPDIEAASRTLDEISRVLMHALSAGPIADPT